MHHVSAAHSQNSDESCILNPAIYDIVLYAKKRPDISRDAKSQNFSVW
jgi:hypothetical protein